MTASDPGELRRVAADLAWQTAELVHHRRRREDLDTRTKSSPTDLVTVLDRAAEAHLASELLERRPRDGLLGEEGTTRSSSSGIQWIVDPIDGTTNFVYGLPTWTVSVAAVDETGTLAGAVAAFALGEVYSAHRGGGATCNDVAIAASPTTEIARALVATGFSYDSATRAEQARRVAGLLPRIRDIRRLGSAALDLCLVASGRVDVYFEEHLNPWDVAAGELIAREAGCRSGDFTGGVARCDQILVSTPALFDAMTSLLDGPREDLR